MKKYQIALVFTFLLCGCNNSNENSRLHEALTLAKTNRNRKPVCFIFPGTHLSRPNEEYCIQFIRKHGEVEIKDSQ